MNRLCFGIEPVDEKEEEKTNKIGGTSAAARTISVSLGVKVALVLAVSLYSIMFLR